MKKLTLVVLAFMMSAIAFAQQKGGEEGAFRAYLYNDEYEVYLKIDFYGQHIVVPDQELYGELPGYLGKKNNPFCWVITSAKVLDAQTAEISLINDYGSEDLTARLVCLNDSTYSLRQLEGSTLKVPKKGRWMKLPKTFELKRRK